jgi:hypothetical protein
MNKTLSTLGLLAAALSLPLSGLAQTTVFSDNFSNGSTLNGTSTPGGTPTASSTSYDIASTKTATSSMGANDLKLGLPSTTSGFLEAQAVFSSSYITLGNVGDTIHLKFTFTDTAAILTTGASQLYVGLFNSGGSAPRTGLQSSGLSATAGSGNATGGTQLWLGYNARIGYVTNTSAIYTRPQQSGAGTSSANQSLLANTGGGSYVNPVGANLTSSSSGAALTAASQYTLDYQISLSAVGTLAITNTLYTGPDITGTLVFTEGALASGANYLTNSFDAFGIGYRFAAPTGVASTIDISSITITDSIASVPEPGTLALTGIGVALAAGWYRRTRK